MKAFVELTFYVISFQWALKLIIKYKNEKSIGMEKVLQDIVDNDHSLAAAQIELENNAVEMSVDDVLVKKQMTSIKLAEKM